MPRIRLVIVDEGKAHAANIAAYERGFLLALAAHPPERRAALRARWRALAEQHAGAPRPIGTVHAALATECPEGRPNCRDCGDPAHAAACQAAGHCPDCGTKHGVAPDSVLLAHGYALEPEA